MQLRHTHIILCCLAMAALTAVVACGGDGEDNDGIRLRDSSKAEAAQAPIDANRIEVPALKSGNKFVCHTVQYNGHTVMNYCLEFDPNRMHSRWVAFRFDGDTRARNVSRQDAWANDPDLPSSMWVGTEYFNGYNRGHLVASNDRRFCREANQQTFYMSNMTPQLGSFNSIYWARLEQVVQTMGWNQYPYKDFADTLYVVKGGFIDNASDLRGSLTRPNGKMMAIPGHYFMALLRVKGKQYDAAGFWLAHTSYPYENAEDVPVTAFIDRNQIVKIDQLEELTGIDFFHNLPDDIETDVESKLSTGIWLKN